MKQQITISFMLFFLCLSFISKAVDIKEGYWVGISKKESESSIFLKIEEWYFKNDSLSFQRYNTNYEVSNLKYSGKYSLGNNELILGDNQNNPIAKIPILIQDDQIVLTITENSTKVFLYYNGEKPNIQDSSWKSDLSNNLFSISTPELFVGAHEVEFWDFASFYTKNKESQCHHEYDVFQFGKHHFILFKQLSPLRIIKKEGKKITLEFLSENRELITSIHINTNPLIDMDILSGKWKWKESGSKPNNINNHYTISVGYQNHFLKIEKDGLIQWFTELYYDKVRKKDPLIIPDRIDFRTREKDEYPFIKISPSGRLIIFESFPIEYMGHGTIRHSRIITLQFIEKSDNKILFKQPSSDKHYVTFIKITD